MPIISYTPINEREVKQAMDNGNKSIVFEAQEIIHLNKRNIFTRNVFVKRFIGCDQETKVNIAREAEAMGNVKKLTPFAPSFINMIEKDNYVDFVMEKINGVQLEEIINSNNLDTDNRIRLFVKVCRILEVLHKNSIIHRDLKPENIMIQSSTDKYDNIYNLQPYLIDFGTSFLLEMYYIGTYKYKAPELDSRKHDKDITNKVDIYSLGIILYRLISKKNIDEIFAKRLDKIVIDNYDQKKLENINNLILRMISEEPNDRPNIKEVIIVLDNITKKWKK